MLTKRKNIRKKEEKKKIQKPSECMARGSSNQTLKEIHAIHSEIIDASDGRTDGRRTDDGRISISCSARALLT